jgi:hypothetical protein
VEGLYNRRVGHGSSDLRRVAIFAQVELRSCDIPGPVFSLLNNRWTRLPRGAYGTMRRAL